MRFALKGHHEDMAGLVITAGSTEGATFFIAVDAGFTTLSIPLDTSEALELIETLRPLAAWQDHEEER